MTELHFEQSRGFAFLTSVLGILCEIELSSGGEPFCPIVEVVAPSTYRIQLGDDCALLVDADRRVVDDPELALPEGFPGRLPLVRGYRLVWRDGESLPVQVTVKASSRRFARLYAGAPEDAYVERV